MTSGCPYCHARVLILDDGICPSCRERVDGEESVQSSTLNPVEKQGLRSQGRMDGMEKPLGVEKVGSSDGHSDDETMGRARESIGDAAVETPPFSRGRCPHCGEEVLFISDECPSCRVSRLAPKETRRHRIDREPAQRSKTNMGFAPLAWVLLLVGAIALIVWKVDRSHRRDAEKKAATERKHELEKKVQRIVEQSQTRNPSLDSFRAVQEARSSYQPALRETERIGEVATFDLGEGQQLTLRYCPAGTFRMGPGGRPDGRKTVEVTLTSPFWLGETEVTQGQWEAIMESNPSKHRGADLPVHSVSFAEVREFLSRLEGRRICDPNWYWGLPSEAQWEFACRAGTSGDFGHQYEPREPGLGVLPFVGGVHCVQGVISFRMALANGPRSSEDSPANAWGFKEMHGNVYEFCADDYFDPLPGGTDPLPLGNPTDRHVVVRGGSWLSRIDACHANARGWVAAEGVRSSGGIISETIGFRLALKSRQPKGQRR